MAETYS
jgi:NADH dehydrogenase FAD-containing subunit